MSFPALIELRDRLDAMLQQVRSERHIVSPVLRCLKCGAIGPSAEPHVSVRAPTEAALPPAPRPWPPAGCALVQQHGRPFSRLNHEVPASVPVYFRTLDFKGVAWAALEIDGVHAGLDGGRRSSHLL